MVFLDSAISLSVGLDQIPFLNDLAVGGKDTLHAIVRILLE